MKVKVRTESLEIRPARPFWGKELTIMKLSYEQAVSYVAIRYFEELKSVYGEENILKEGENYDGYVLVFNAPTYQEIVRMSGKLIRDTKSDCWIVVRGSRSVPPKWTYFWSIQQCLFQEVADMKIRRKELSLSEDVVDVSASLKKKLLEAMKKKNEADLTSAEYAVLRAYFLPSDYEKIFIED